MAFIMIIIAIALFVAFIFYRQSLEKKKYKDSNYLPQFEELNAYPLCNSTNIYKVETQTPQLIKMIDVLGRTQIEHLEGDLLFYIYDDGKVIKTYK